MPLCNAVAVLPALPGHTRLPEDMLAPCADTGALARGQRRGRLTLARHRPGRNGAFGLGEDRRRHTAPGTWAGAATAGHEESLLVKPLAGGSPAIEGAKQTGFQRHRA